MDLVGLAEIVDMLNVSRARADQLSRQKAFPDPIATIAAGRIWYRSDVEDWMKENGR
jgi:prophage regulatory protein